VASHRLGRKIYQLGVLKVPSGIIVISVITVGSAVQIKRSRLSSVSTSITCRGDPDTRQVGVRITVNTSQYCAAGNSYLLEL
jgi:hypothetical protein